MKSADIILINPHWEYKINISKNFNTVIKTLKSLSVYLEFGNTVANEINNLTCCR